MSARSEATDEELVAEQRDFYDADARSYDEWLRSLLSKDNTAAVAVGYRLAEL